MKALLVILVTALSLTGCAGSFLKATNLDPKSGYFPTGTSSAPKKAETVINQKIDPKLAKELILAGGPFMRDSLRNTGLFTMVIDMDELQTQVVQANLQDKIPSLREKIGLNNAYRNYRKFLWVYLDRETVDNVLYHELVAVDPGSLQEVFKARVKTDVWNGNNDQNTYYPLLNAFIDWTKANQ